MNFSFTYSMVRELRGSPITVLVAIMLLERAGQVPVTAQLLKDVTGYRDHTITDCLRTLSLPTRQIVVRALGGWRLANGINLVLPLENREYRESLSSSSSSLNKKEQSLLSEQEQERVENREYRDSSVHRKAIELGIHEPKASEIAGLVHVTAEYIEAHIKQAQDEGHLIGTAIYRITHGWAARGSRPGKVNGHKDECKCGDCQLIKIGVGLCSECLRATPNCECEE